jgi:serine/threonine-protein phosphatase CPPED1
LTKNIIILWLIKFCLEEFIDSYKSDFGDDYFSFWVSGCKFICVNTQLYFNSSLVPELKIEQDKWLDEELTRRSDNDPKHLVIFHHIAPFTTKIDEPFEYFNLDINERKDLLRRYKKAGVSKIFCGHCHRNAIVHYQNIEIVITTAVGAQLGDDKHGFRVVRVDENEISHEYVAVSDEIN